MLNIASPKLKQIANVLKVGYEGADVGFSGVSIDSRTTVPKDLFVALKGPNFDGHDYVGKAIKQGAVAALVSKKIAEVVPLIKVEDTQSALTDMARAWRDTVNIKVVGITGSNGKTTVKEMVASVFAISEPGIKTDGNLNNHIGVPLTLLKIKPEHKWAVIEMGASGPNEIDALAQIVRPKVALINNIATAHITGFGSVEQIAQTKGEIYKYLPKDGVAIIPCGSKFSNLWQEQSATKNIVTFGKDNAADISVISHADKIELKTPKGVIGLSLALGGRHNHLNAAAATAIALQFGISLEQIKQGLEQTKAVKGRLQTDIHKTGAKIIDDTYNANPNSAKAALQYLASLGGRKIFVLGDMGELGDLADKAHKQTGELATDLQIDEFYSFGKHSQRASDGFSGIAQHFQDMDKLAEHLAKNLDKNTVVLVKGSRFMRMERLVQSLLGDKI